MVDRRNFFDQRIKNDWRTYDNIQKISTCQGDDDYTTWCLLDYPYFEKYYKLIAIDLNKQQKLDADSKAIQKINFTGNQQSFSILKKQKKLFYIFSQPTVKLL